MPTTSLQKVTDLKLDLKNFRTVPQKSEKSAIKAMIAIGPDKFHAIMESLIEDGYIPTETIIVLKESSALIVKEGNRRVAALKLIHGQYKISEFGLPDSILKQVANLDDTWKKDNLSVPCTIFSKKEEAKADKFVALAHAKGEKAGRDNWNSVARARHNRDAKKVPEPALDLLERYLETGNNVNNQQKERWAGAYPVTILHEAIRLIHPRYGFKSIAELVSAYPKKMKQVAGLEALIRDVGIELIGFKQLRDPSKDFAIKYGATPIPPTSSSGTKTNASQSTNAPQASTVPAAKKATPPAEEAFALTDPKHVIDQLKKFTPRGNNRQKVVTLRDEILVMKINKTPIAFCFLLRSMFEISAKEYCKDHTIPLTRLQKGNQIDKTLVQLLEDVTNDLTQSNSNKAVVKILHGAFTEMKKPAGMLSVTSMNQLVHSNSFSVAPADICRLFGKIYPLLEGMN